MNDLCCVQKEFTLNEIKNATKIKSQGHNAQGSIFPTLSAIALPDEKLSVTRKTVLRFIYTTLN